MNKERNGLVFEHETALDGVHSGIGGGSGSLAHGGVRGEGGGERERCCSLREGEGRKRKRTRSERRRRRMSVNFYTGEVPFKQVLAQSNDDRGMCHLWISFSFVPEPLTLLISYPPVHVFNVYIHIYIVTNQVKGQIFCLQILLFLLFKYFITLNNNY